MPATTLNQDCQCTTLNVPSLHQAWHDSVGDTAVADFFAPYGVFLSTAQVQALQAAVAALHRVSELPAVVASVAAAQGAGLPRYGTRGVCMGYDFHFDGDTPRLIEINTNAGGALLNALLLAHQSHCCPDVQEFRARPGTVPGELFLDMFRREWQAAGRRDAPRHIAIVDDNPHAQFLYPEFLLFKKLFDSAGWHTVICAPEELERRGDRLVAKGVAVDLVYNRLTDFALLEPQHACLREAWLEGVIVLSPDPWHHALQADKRNLAHLGDPEWLQDKGVAREDRRMLEAMVPATDIVGLENAEALWTARKGLFFKPFRGYGSKAAYRGDKLTRGVWANIVASRDYIAQAYAPPGARRVRVGGELRELKFDVRCYAYAGEVLLLAARLYQGQATNLRTPGGGFAPVFVSGAGAASGPRSCAADRG